MSKKPLILFPSNSTMGAFIEEELASSLDADVLGYFLDSPPCGEPDSDVAESPDCIVIDLDQGTDEEIQEFIKKSQSHLPNVSIILLAINEDAEDSVKALSGENIDCFYMDDSRMEGYKPPPEPQTSLSRLVDFIKSRLPSGR